MANTLAQSQRTLVQNPDHLAYVATLAMVGQVVLLASAWLLPFVSEYSLIRDNISELVLGRYGFVQTLAFLIAGVGTLGLAFAIRKLTARSRGSTIGTLLIAVYGAGAILSAIFPTDRIDSSVDALSLSTPGTIHVIVALVSFLCVVVGMFVLTWTLRREASWRSIVPWLALFFSAALPLIFAQAEGPFVGLLQRLFVTAVSVWLMLVAFRIRSIVRSGLAHTSD